MGETHRYDRTNNAVRAVHVHCLVTAPRLLDVGGIICSVGDDDAVGLSVRGVHLFRGLHIRSTHGCNPITALRF